MPSDHDAGLPSPLTGRSVLPAAAIGAALTPLNSTMVAVALPAMSAEFNAQASSVTVAVVTGYLVATLVLQMPAGRLADRIGHTRALAAGRWLFAAGAVAGAAAPSLTLLVVGRLLVAAGGALINPTTMALVRVAVPPDRRARAFGSMGAVMGGAAAIGPGLGAWLTAAFGWRSLFVVNLPLLAVSWLVQPRPGGAASIERAFRSGQPDGPRSAPFDWKGSVLIAVALLLVMLATRVASLLALALALAGAGVFAVFVWHERRVSAPVLNLPLFGRRGFVAGAGVIATQNLTMYSLLIQVPFLFGGDPRLGLAIVAMTLTMAITSPIGGWLVEHLGTRLVTATGGAIGALGVAWLSALPSQASAREVGTRLLLVGLGLGLSTGPATAAAISAAPPHESASASSAVSMLRYLGAIAGTVVLGALLAGDAAGERHAAIFWILVAALLASSFLGLGLPTRAPA